MNLSTAEKIKQDILGGETFESQARIYSEDEGSASNGGLMKNINKGQMVKPLKQQH
jgi:peptidyl-prolyl cis-trans isomerase SurA